MKAKYFFFECELQKFYLVSQGNQEETVNYDFLLTS